MNDYEMEALAEDYEEDYDEMLSAEFDEAFEEDYEEGRKKWRPRRHPRAKPARGVKSFRKAPPPARDVVRQAQLKAALAVVDKKISVNAHAIKVVDKLSHNTASQTSRMGHSLRKEISIRKKENDAIRNNMQMLAITPLLFDSSTTFGKIAPLLMTSDAFGGSSSSSSSSGGFLGGGNSGMGIIMLAALAGGL